jgi:hypothetical protein
MFSAFQHHKAPNLTLLIVGSFFHFKHSLDLQLRK